MGRRGKKNRASFSTRAPLAHRNTLVYTRHDTKTQPKEVLILTEVLSETNLSILAGSKQNGSRCVGSFSHYETTHTVVQKMWRRKNSSVFPRARVRNHSLGDRLKTRVEERRGQVQTRRIGNVPQPAAWRRPVGEPTFSLPSISSMRVGIY